MNQTGRDPKLWEQGCKDDPVRNQVVLPDLIECLDRLRPTLIGDVGSGTGYLSRAAALHYAYPAHWFLLERDPRMLQFSSEICATKDGLEVVDYDLVNPAQEWDRPLDLAFSCFSSLDFGMTTAIAGRLVDLLKPQASLLIYIPDLLEEVTQVCKLDGNLDALEYYRRGEFEVRKPDRFTKRVEPFLADRIEKYIGNLLIAGCHLRALRFLNRGSDRRIVAMEFSRVA